MGERDYGHREVVDKLGIAPGQAVALVQLGWEIGQALRQRVLARTGRPTAEPGDVVDVALVALGAGDDPGRVLADWRPRLRPAGAVWLLTPKRAQPGYLSQQALIDAGLAAGLVDNKVCSVSETTSAMRFVIRRRDRPAPS